MNLTAGAGSAALKRVVAKHMAVISDEAVQLSQAIHDDPELGFAEYHASARVAAMLEDAGFAVRRDVADLPTAVSASHGSGELVIGLFAEYDALPGIGHACGHNIIAAAAVTAGRLLAPVAGDLGITVKVFGTPAEEFGGGKALMLEDGVFDGLHAAMMVHPAPMDAVGASSLAVDHLIVEYTGQTAHASVSPHLGRNAADAFTVAQVGIGLLRQHLPAGVQVHGIITDGGEAPNVVPGHTAGGFYIRADDGEQLRAARPRIERCFEAGALATGCELSIRLESPTYESLATDNGLNALYKSNAEALGRAVKETPPGFRGGSTDMGNISQVIPTIHPGIGVDSAGAVNHQPEFAACCGAPTGDIAVIDGALALAWTVIDIATIAEQRDRLLARSWASLPR
jgi:amidohydrolase